MIGLTRPFISFTSHFPMHILHMDRRKYFYRDLIPIWGSSFTIIIGTKMTFLKYSTIHGSETQITFDECVCNSRLTNALRKSMNRPDEGNASLRWGLYLEAVGLCRECNSFRNHGNSLARVQWRIMPMTPVSAPLCWQQCCVKQMNDHWIGCALQGSWPVRASFFLWMIRSRQ